MRLHKIFGPIARWKIELRPLRDPSIKRQKMRWHALMSGDDINYSTKPTKPNFVKYEEFPKNMHQLEVLQIILFEIDCAILYKNLQEFLASS